MITLATRTMDGIDVLILKDEDGIGFICCGPEFTPAAREECMAIAAVHKLAFEATAPAPPRPQVKPKGILAWIRSLAPRTPLKNDPTGVRR